MLQVEAKWYVDWPEVRYEEKMGVRVSPRYLAWANGGLVAIERAGEGSGAQSWKS